MIDKHKRLRVATRPSEVNIEVEPSVDGNEGKEPLGTLIDHIYDTKPGKMAEMTNVSLDQVLPQSMISMYAQEARLLCEDMRKAQVEYNKIWGKYHNSDECVDVETDPDYDVEALVLLMEEWQYYYYQVRRSVKGDHEMGAIHLAEIQMQAQQPSLDDEWTRIVKQ